MDTEIINLEYPIEIKSSNGGVITATSITLRRMKAKDLKHVKPDTASDPYSTIPLIAALADIPIESADEIDMIDLKKIQEKLSIFLEGFQGSGSKSSGESQASIISPPAISGI